MVCEYFDEVLLLNMRIVVSGFVDEVFNEFNFCKMYGGKFFFLD